MADRIIMSVAKLGKVYQTKTASVEALLDISFDVRQGDFIVIVGPSGCGKSTFLNIIAGLIPHTSGTVTIMGKKLEGPTEGIGMIFQRPVLMPWRTVFKNIMLPAEIHKLDYEKYSERAKDLIKLVGLTGFEKMYPYELSGGMQQRVSLCRALLTDPPVLLMDEPFGALDAMTREQMDAELLRITSSGDERRTVVFVTHSVAEAVFLANKIVVMTCRPASIKRILEIELPRERDLSVMGSAQFAHYCAQIRKDLGVAGAA